MILALLLALSGVEGLALAQDLPDALERLNSDLAAVRHQASLDLRKIGLPAIPHLEKLASSNDPELAVRAASLVKVITVASMLTAPFKEALPGVEDRIASGGDAAWWAAFRDATAVRRGERLHPKLRSEDLAPLLERAYKGIQQPGEMSMFCAGVEEFGIKEAVPLLRALLKKEPFDAQAEAVAALGVVGSRDLAPELEALLKDEDRHLRTETIRALGRLGSPGSIAPIRRFLRASDAQCLAAMISLAQLGDRESIPEFVAHLAIDGMQNTASDALILLQAKEVVPELVQSLRRREPRVSPATIDVILRLGSPDDIGALYPLLEAAEETGRANAALALGTAGQRDAIPRLEDLLADASPTVRAHALAALHLLSARETAQSVVALLADPNERLADSAMRWLVELETAAAAPKVAKLLETASPSVKVKALQTLTGLMATSEVPAIAGRLHDVDLEVRVAALRALGTLHATSTIPQITPLLRKDDDALGEVVETLGRLGATDAIPKIREVADGARAPIAARAALALARLGNLEGSRLLLLGGSAYIEARGFFALNRLRQPDLWRKLESQMLPATKLGYPGDLIPQLLEPVGLKVDEWPSQTYKDASAFGLGPSRISSPGGRRTLLDALEGELSNLATDVILEPDGIRILSHAKAMEFWRDWLREPR